MTRIPAAWSFSTTHLGGTPTADTKRTAFSYTYRSEVISNGQWGTACALQKIWTHFDDNIDQLGQLTLLVVVLEPPMCASGQPHVE
jgi:hypothetical protein